MSIPASYRAQDVSKRCKLCEHSDSVNGRIYCRFNAPSIMKVLMNREHDGKTVADVIGDTRVDPVGVCDEFQSIEA